MFTSQELRASAERAKACSTLLMKVPEEVRTRSILAIKKALLQDLPHILAANQRDVEAAKIHGLSLALIDRLTLDETRIQSLADSLQKIAEAPAVLGQIEHHSISSKGFTIDRKRIPLGVIGVIFESRPNVLIDCAALAIKSGNSILLKAGNDAQHSNEALGKLVKKAIAPYLPDDCIQLIPSGDRSLTIQLVQLVGLVDLIIPRGGESLIRMIQEHARVPVIAHAKGLCHLYIHADARTEHAIAITLNAKTQRPSVCNAIETLLVHEELQHRFLPDLLDALLTAGVELRVDGRLAELYPQYKLTKAIAEDWDTEYLDKILAVRMVKDEDEAIEHILKHGSHHTEAIVAEDPCVQQRFETSIDASCIAINVSTRFNDGGELGLGAEIGISTSKLHAYGPMGAKELTTTRFVVRGDGHCRTS